MLWMMSMFSRLFGNSADRTRSILSGFLPINMKDIGVLITLALLWCSINSIRRSLSQEDRLKVIPAKNPTRFFSKGSPVRDYYKGELSGLTHAAQTNDITFIFFYASWCLASENARPEFEKTASSFKDHAAFIAVNCGLYGSPCALKRRPGHFPLIGAFIKWQPTLFIPYTGFPSADHMAVFVRRILRPYSVIDNVEEYERFTEENNLVVMVNMGLSTLRPIATFWNTTLQLARHDPRHEAKFGVVTDHFVARKLGFPEQNAIRIYRSGVRVQTISRSQRRTDVSLEAAVLRHVKTLVSTIRLRLPQTNASFSSEQPVKWIFPAFHRSTVLSDTLQNATLVMFTPYEVAGRSNAVLQLMRKVISVYEDCQRRIDLSVLFSARHDRTNPVSAVECEKLQQRCQMLKNHLSGLKLVKERFQRSLRQKCVCSSVNSSSSVIQDFCWTKNPYKLSPVFSPYLPRPARNSTLPCKGRTGCFCGFAQNRVFSTCCYAGESSSLTDQKIGLMQLDNCENERRRCAVMPASGGVLRGQEDFDAVQRIHGLKCATNRSLEVVAIDPRAYPMFLENLDAVLGKSGSRLLIIDRQASERYVMEAEIDARSVAEFLYDHTASQLRAHRRTGRARIHSAAEKTVSHSGRSLIIEDVSAEMFPSLLESQEDIVMLYYTPWCAFCKSMASVFYNVAAKFLDVPGIVFKRINTHQNELPWEYRMLRAPSVQIFPTHRKKDNVATFPADMPLNPRNLLKFVVLHVDISVWRSFISTRCDSSCWLSNQKRSTRLLRSLKRDLKHLRRARSKAMEFGASLDGFNWKIRKALETKQVLGRLIYSEGARQFFLDLLDNQTHNVELTSLRKKILETR